MKNVTIETPKGYGNVEKIYISELGFFMVRVAFENGTYVTYNLGKHNPDDNFLTNKLMETEIELNL